MNKNILETFTWLNKLPLLTGQAPPKFLKQKNAKKSARYNLINLIDITNNEDYIADYEIIKDILFIRLRLKKNKWYFVSGCVINNGKTHNITNYSVLIIYILNVLFNDFTFGKIYVIQYNIENNNIDNNPKRQKKFLLLCGAKEDNDDTYIIYHKSSRKPNYIITLDRELWNGCIDWQEKTIN